MLKKLILLSCLLPLISFAGNNFFKPDKETIKLKGSSEIIDKKYHFVVEPHQHYYTKIAYPQIIGLDGKPSQVEFNQAVSKIIKTNQEEFSKNLQATLQMIKEKGTQGMPALTEDSNYLIIQYQLANPQNNLISVRFNIESMNYGMAHPNSAVTVLNYDITTHKIVELKDLFKPNSDYLKTIANYSQNALTKRFAKTGNNDKSAQDLINQGTAADLKNYMNWNIVPKGLLITFSRYQVAPGYMGQPEVLIPMNVLKNELAS